MTNELLLGQFIPIHYQAQMLQDDVRMKNFKEAIRLTVTPNSRVLEYGGGTGALTFFAAQYASKVWSVERQPGLASKAREFIEFNVHKAEVEIVLGDAFDYLPPEPVETIICEMLHSALLREKQVEVLASFKRRYLARFGTPLPLFVPEATILAIEPIEQDYNFFGYIAPVPMFQQAGTAMRTTPLGAPSVYAIVQYSEQYNLSFEFDQIIHITRAGNFNALRFITSNALYILVKENRTINWMNQNLILPLRTPLQVNAGDEIHVRLSYQAGGEIDELQQSIELI